jgi:hypothetical protein
VNIAVVAASSPLGPLSMTVCGAVLSTSRTRVALPGLPAASSASAVSVWVPSGKAVVSQVPRGGHRRRRRWRCRRQRRGQRLRADAQRRP